MESASLCDVAEPVGPMLPDLADGDEKVKGPRTPKSLRDIDLKAI